MNRNIKKNKFKSKGTSKHHHLGRREKLNTNYDIEEDEAAAIAKLKQEGR